LRANTKALVHARLLAALFQSRDLGTVLSLKSIITHARTVTALPVVAAILQSSTSFEAAVVARISWMAMASMLLTIALSVVGARIGTVLDSAISSTVIGRTVACSIEATSMRLIAATIATSNTAINALESRIASTVLAVGIADTVAAAVIGTSLNL